MPEMAREVPRLLKENAWPTKQLVVMGGHKEGVMAYGTSLGGRRSAELLRSYVSAFNNVNQPTWWSARRILMKVQLSPTTRHRLDVQGFDGIPDQTLAPVASLSAARFSSWR